MMFLTPSTVQLESLLNSPSGGSKLLCLVRDLSFWDASQPPTLRKRHRSAPDVVGDELVETTNESRSMGRSKSTNNATAHQEKTKSAKSVWKSAVDPISGRTYYYDAVTRVTQWEKPAEVRAMEKRKKAERKRRNRRFFDEMEGNILASLSRGELIPNVPPQSMEKTGPPQEPPVTASRVRTLSGMESLLLAELQVEGGEAATATAANASSAKKHVWNNASGPKPGRSGLPPRPGRQRMEASVGSLELSPDEQRLPRETSSVSSSSSSSMVRVESSDALAGEHLLDEPIHQEQFLVLPTQPGEQDGQLPKPAPYHTRRNTGGTIYAKTTMTNPNISATIKCVCGVYRAHIVQTAERRGSSSPVSVMGSSNVDVDVFRDDFGAYRQRKDPDLPSLSDIVAFCQEFYVRSQMEHDTIIMSLIYVERLIKETSGVLAPMQENWRSVLFSCMVLASKVWDDLSMWNIDFSNVSATTAGLSSFTLRRINELELALLKSLSFDVRVQASEYAKYYFLIRTMLFRSGLLDQEEKGLPIIQKEEKFKSLETKTVQYQDRKLSPRTRRAKSVDGQFFGWLDSQAAFAHQNNAEPVLKDKICLEQLVSMKG